MFHRGGENEVKCGCYSRSDEISRAIATLYIKQCDALTERGILTDPGIRTD